MTASILDSPSRTLEVHAAHARVLELEQEVADLRQDAARYRWLHASLSKAADQGSIEFPADGTVPSLTVECHMLWGHRSTRAMRASLTWQEFREGPLDLSSAIDEQLVREAPAKGGAA